MSVPRPAPFAALLAFEAILRLGSFTAAARALNLTQSAVSHRIRQLEHHYGCRLIERLNPGLRATAAGKRLLAALAPVLAQLGALDAQVGSRRRHGFRLGLGQALLSCWLSPRLPDLAAAFPRLDFEIVVLADAAQARKSDADLVLEWLPRAAFGGGPHALAFPVESVFPVCRPDIAARVNDWRRLKLIQKGSGDEDGMSAEWRWSSWAGRDAVPSGPRFADLADSLQAAIDGNGVALARSLLAADALRAGRLCRLPAKPSFRTSTKLQTARWRAGTNDVAAPVALWLADAAARTLYRPKTMTEPSRATVQS